MRVGYKNIEAPWLLLRCTLSNCPAYKQLQELAASRAGSKDTTTRLFAMNQPEWAYALAGVLASLALGAEMPGMLSRAAGQRRPRMPAVWCRCARLASKPKLQSALPCAGFALALSGITVSYYQPDPDDIKADGR